MIVTVLLLMMATLIEMVSITAYAAFPPVVTASWRSEFRKIEIVDETGDTSDEVETDSSDEVVDFTGDVGLDEQNPVVPDTTSYDEEETDEAGGVVFVIVAVEDQEEADEPEEPMEDQIETQIEEPITPPDEADENI